MPKQAPEPAPAIVRISTNTMWEGKFYNAYEPLPFARAEDLPENLRPLAVTDLPEGEEPDGPQNAVFQLNTPYQVDGDGRLGHQLQRRVQREIAELEAENAQEEWLE